MSSSITQCPGCYTRFRVTTEQLTAHNGIVRCGLCSAIFNAPEHLHDDEPSPQLTLPITHTDVQDQSPAEVVEPEKPIEVPEPHAVALSSEFDSPVEGTDELETLFQQIEADEDNVHLSFNKPEPKPRKWPWITGSVILLIVGFAQFTYFFRVDLAAQLPGLKPALISYCDLLNCKVPLPTKVDLMGIESSDMEADPLQPTTINLSAALHNRADYAQAYPNIELSLTDTQDKVLARRIFTPTDYLKTGEDEKLGIFANRELNIKLHLDTADLNPSGYKLFIFYPPQ